MLQELSLHCAVAHDSVETLQNLISQGADVNAKDKTGATPLHEAARWQRNIGVLRYLVSEGADVNAKNSNGSTPLFVAAVGNSVRVSQYLQALGADIHAKDNDGNTPLHVAAMHHSIENLRCLIANGADINAKNNKGKIPLDVVTTNEYADETKRILREAMGKKNQPNSPIEFSYRVTEKFIAGEYPFERTIKEGKPKLKALLDAGVTYFIDLTSEGLKPYRDYLPKYCTYLNLPIPDLTIPSLEDLKTIHELITSFDDVFYVHCRGGFDRTAIVVATYFIFEGKTVAAAKKLYFQKAAKQRLRYYPRLSMLESQWNVLKDYKKYLKQPVEVPVNEHAVRILYEGLNANQQWRRIIYYPYMDGHVQLLITDAEGDVKNVLEAQDVSMHNLPDEYIYDVPFEYRPHIPDPYDV